MSRQGTFRRAGGRTARLAPPLAWGLAIAAGLGSALFSTPSRAQPPPAAAVPAPTTPAPAPGTAAVGPGAAPAVGGATAVLPPDVQVVRFHGPEGVRVEVVAPNTEPVPVGDGHGLLTVGLKVGVSYRLRLSNLPDRPGAEIFPVIELVGHLHRPPGIDPGKYPIRVVFGQEDLDDVVDHGRLVTQVIYLEDPDQALPIALPKDQIPLVTLTPSEDPLTVASALGRVVAIVRVGNRRPTADEPADAVLAAAPGAGAHCPFMGPGGGPCSLPCGPVCGTPPAPGQPWAPRDEFLCDGGDRGEPVRFSGDGGLRGIDPRDAVIQFNDGKRGRVLPTNVVCLYAPRFAEVRTSLGTNEALAVEGTVRTKFLEKQATEAARLGPKRLTQRDAVEEDWHRARASGLSSRVRPGVHSELRVLSGYDSVAHMALFRLRQKTQLERERQKAALMRDRAKAVGIKTVESAVVTGVVQGATETVMTWTPRDVVGVETPPNQPGLAVVKRVSASEAEAGDEVTFVIQYRNMGNTPIRSVSIVDSLLPRLGYVPGSAEGPTGTVFTAGENRVGATELRWEIPGTIPPGGEGQVLFKTIVR